LLSGVANVGHLEPLKSIKMKHLFIFATFIWLAACNKEEPIKPTCQRVYFLSDKYTYDTIYVKTDSLWPWGKHNNDFCNSDTLQFSNDERILKICADSTLEVRRWVIGNKITSYTIFRKG